MASAARIAIPSASVARAQAAWIAAIEPWRGLGYRRVALARYLGSKARARRVWVARASARGGPVGLIVADDGFLLGGLITLLAVRPGSAGQGVGRALLEHVAAVTFGTRRWLFVSCDGNNGRALRFYRKSGFSRVGRLPDLVARGRVEILLRRAAPPRGAESGRAPRAARGAPPAKFRAGAARVGYHGGRS